MRTILKTSQEPQSALDRLVEHRLGQSDVRYTRGRRRVIHALAGADGPLSAADLHAVLASDVPLSSLYRSLAVLEETGVVAPHYSTSVTRYELAEWLSGHHHHLVCSECGTVEDIEVSAQVEDTLQSIVQGIGSGTGFRPTDHALEIVGQCGDCS